MLQLVLAHDKTKKAHSPSKQSYKFKQELNIHQMENVIFEGIYLCWISNSKDIKINPNQYAGLLRQFFEN